MPFPRSKLDAYLVFLDTSLSVEHLFKQFQQWQANGSILEDGTQASKHDDFGFKSFYKVQVIDSRKPKLFANHQGGYRVCCPKNDKIVTVDFVAGIAKWRAGEDAPEDIIIKCSGCNGEHALIEFVGKPALAFGTCAFRFSDIHSANISSSVAADIEKNVGRFSLVLKRVG